MYTSIYNILQISLAKLFVYRAHHCKGVRAERYTMRMIKAINKYLYEELGYKGATNYLDPDNSCINMVLKRREGKAI